jgi:hypothetical protein
VIIGTGFMDVGLLDDYYPLNLGRIMMVDVGFKNISLSEFMPQILVILEFTLALILIAYFIFKKRQSLA